MKLIRLDASRWEEPNDFYSALLPALGAPAWHGRNLDALADSIGGGINRQEPPFKIVIVGAKQQSKEFKEFMETVAAVFESARDELKTDLFFETD